MPVDLFTFIDLYRRVLVTAEHLLARGWAHAQSLGVSEAEMLDWRLIEDMQPLSFQIMVVCNFTRSFPARVAGLPATTDIGTDLTLAQFQAAIAEAKAYLEGLTAEQFAGRDEVPLTVPIGDGEMRPTLPSGQWLTVFATTNIYFHLSTAYGILRAHGVPIGKMDLFASGL